MTAEVISIVHYLAYRKIPTLAKRCSLATNLNMRGDAGELEAKLAEQIIRFSNLARAQNEFALWKEVKSNLEQDHPHLPQYIWNLLSHY